MWLHLGDCGGFRALSGSGAGAGAWPAARLQASSFPPHAACIRRCRARCAAGAQAAQDGGAGPNQGLCQGAAPRRRRQVSFVLWLRCLAACCRCACAVLCCTVPTLPPYRPSRPHLGLRSAPLAQPALWAHPVPPFFHPAPLPPQRGGDGAGEERGGVGQEAPAQGGEGRRQGRLQAQAERAQGEEPQAVTAAWRQCCRRQRAVLPLRLLGRLQRQLPPDLCASWLGTAACSQRLGRKV